MWNDIWDELLFICEHVELDSWVIKQGFGGIEGLLFDKFWRLTILYIQFNPKNVDLDNRNKRVYEMDSLERSPIAISKSS